MKSDIAVFLNILIIIFEFCGFYLSFKAVKWRIVIYYTEISNFIALIASILLLCHSAAVPMWRYCAVVMLLMTFLITLFILVPSIDNGMQILMLSGNGLFHHLLVPLISLFSYIFLEAHDSSWYIPVIISLIYGLLMYYLNYIGKMDGPYPFFKVQVQGIKRSVIWIFILLTIVSAISFSVLAFAG